MTHEELMSHTEEERQFYLESVKGLPTGGGFKGTGFDKYGKQIPWGLGPHSIKCMKRAIAIFKPTSILEIGFNCGWSSSMWLNMCDASIVGVDISDKDETIEGARILTERFSGRFKFVLSGSQTVYDKVNDMQFDMIFIDGDHTAAGICSDVNLGIRLGIKNFFFDDWLPQFGETQVALKNMPIKVIEVIGNMALGELL
jgi:predicted O-methyltransferase YrrM